MSVLLILLEAFFYATWLGQYGRPFVKFSVLWNLDRKIQCTADLEKSSPVRTLAPYGINIRRHKWHTCTGKVYPTCRPSGPHTKEPYACMLRSETLLAKPRSCRKKHHKGLSPYVFPLLNGSRFKINQHRSSRFSKTRAAQEHSSCGNLAIRTLF
jgi:hypothetical protein